MENGLHKVVGYDVPIPLVGGEGEGDECHGSGMLMAARIIPR